MSERRDNRICILGMGYVGLTLAAVMADVGFEVTGIEIDPRILASIRDGEAHFYEQSMDLAVRRGLTSGRLRFEDTIPPQEAFDVYIITVGTPLGADGDSRMDMVENVARDIAAHMGDDALIILRSTVRLGTTHNVIKPALEASGRRFRIAFCPERTIEGRALEELRSLPQIVGGDDEAATERAIRIFRRLTPTIVEVSSVRTAELIKLLDNSYRDVFFAFGNEVAMLCEALSLDAAEVILAANTGYPRTNIAQPGFVGGPCLEKDPHILQQSLRDADHVPRLIHTARDLNDQLVGHGLERVLGRLDGRKGLTISLMGLAFKGRPDTDDLRGSPSLLMRDEIRRRLPDADLRGQDYIVSDAAIHRLGLEPVDEVGAFRGADLVLVLNNNTRYGLLDVDRLSATMNRPGVIGDFWNSFAHRASLPEGIQAYVLGS